MTDLVQTSGVQKDNAVATSSTFTMPGNFTAGKSAVCAISHYETVGNRISGVTLGGTAATRDAQKTSGVQSVEIWRADNIAGGTADFVITYGGGAGNYVSCGCEEWNSFTRVDTPTLNTTNATGANPSISTATGTAQNVETCYAVMAFTDSATPTITPPGGSWVQAWENENGSTQIPGSGVYIELTSAGTQTATWSSSSLTWFAATLAYSFTAMPPTTLGQFDPDMRLSHWF